MKFISTINKEDKKESVLLLGRGPSTDNLNLKAINEQKKMDICCISDACKIIEHPTYTFHYHYASIARCLYYLHLSKYLMLNTNAWEKLKLKPQFSEKYVPIINNLTNMRFFISKHIKLPAIEAELFDVQVKNTLYNYCGSVVGAFNFLAGYMNYKNIYYIGFDGGEKYGQAQYGFNVSNTRKETKIAGSVDKYFESWKGLKFMLKHYSDIKFKKLGEFLK